MRPIVPFAWFTLLFVTFAPGSAQAQMRRVFVTSTIHPANFATFDPGGLAVADAECNALAEAASLPGTYRAWLSDGGDAKDRLSPGSGPFVQAFMGDFIHVGGEKIADDIADLTDGSLDAAIALDEEGRPVMGADVWTGTEPDGTSNSVSGTCNGWTELTGTTRPGNPQETSGDWTEDSVESCDTRRRFYCFEVRYPSIDPSTPELTATVNGDDVTLNWTQADFPASQEARALATSYILKFGTSPGAHPGILILPQVLTHTQNDVPDGTYYAVVHGVRAGKEGPASNEVQIAVGTRMLPGPTTLEASVVGNRVRFRWTASIGATAYRFRFGTVSGQYGAPTTFGGNILEVTGTLNTSTRVFAVVRGVNEFGPGPNSNEVSVIPDPP